MRRLWRELRGGILGLVLFAAAALVCVQGAKTAENAGAAESLRIARDSVLRAAVSCYAAEGRYPASYEYLKENYGIAVDEEKFAVHYEVFASNLMPEITVVER